MKKCGIFVCLLLLLSLLPAANVVSADRLKSITQYDHDSRYYRIMVVDYPEIDRRILYFSKTRGAQSSMILSQPKKLGLSYLRTMFSSFALHEKPRKVLLVGLGGAAIPKFIAEHYPEIELDIVEIDPDVVKVAQRYFHFKPTSNMRIYAMDGRLFLKQVNKQYDMILLDAYASDSLPFHLTTREFFELVKARLTEDGVVAANLWEYFVNRFYLSELKTVQSVFPQTYLLNTPDPASKVLFATVDDDVVSEQAWVARAREFSRGKDLGYDLPALVDREYSRITDMEIEEDVLIDDMAPVDILRTMRAGN